MTSITSRIDYRNYNILTVFDYHNGTFDFQYQSISDPENSGLAARTTLEKVKREIDDELLESDLVEMQGHVVYK